MTEFETDPAEEFLEGQDKVHNDDDQREYFIESQLNGFVIEVSGSDVGDKIHMAKFNGSRSQRWKLTKQGNIESSLNGLVLGIDHDGDQTEVPPCVAVTTCLKNETCFKQKWTYNQDERQIEFQGNGFSDSAMVMDIAWANMLEGATVHLWPKNHGASQTWTLEEHVAALQRNSSFHMSITSVEQRRWVDATLNFKHRKNALLPPRSFYIETSVGGKVLEVSSEVIGANLVLSDKDGTDGQIWRYNHTGEIVSEMNGLVLYLKNDGSNPCAEVIMHEVNNCNNQRWRLLENGCIQSKLSGHALEMMKECHRTNNLIHANEVTGSRTQQWNFFPLNTSQLTSQTSFTESQIFSLSNTERNKSIYIQSEMNGLALTAVKVPRRRNRSSLDMLKSFIAEKEEVKSPWTVQLMRRKDDDLAQKWVLTDEFELKSEFNGLVLDIANASSREGLILDLYERNGGINQKWELCYDGRIKSKMNGMVIEQISGNTNGKISLVPERDCDLQFWEWFE